MNVRWTKPADRDFQQLLDYLEERNPKAALRMGNLIVRSVDTLKKFPHSGRPGRHLGSREMVVHASYTVVYMLTDKEIVILRVLHTAQQCPPE